MNNPQNTFSDFSDLMKLADSDAGRKLLNLVKKNSTPELESAMQQAQSGDLSQAQEMIRKILETPEAAAFIQQLRGNT